MINDIATVWFALLTGSPLTALFALFMILAPLYFVINWIARAGSYAGIRR